MTDPSTPPADKTPSRGRTTKSATREQDDESPGSADGIQEEGLNEALDRFVAKTNAEVHGLFQILGSKRRLMWVNFLAGLSRGVGFFLGVTLIGGLIIGGVALAIDTAASTLGLKDITFKSMVRIFAAKANEAQAVWSDARADTAGLPQATPVPDDQEFVGPVRPPEDSDQR